MKKLFLVFIGMLFGLLVQAQSISVKDFHLVGNDLTARTHGTSVEDQNGYLCALIKVPTTERGIWSFDVGMLGVRKMEMQNEAHAAEIWVYVPFGVTWISIQHERFGLLEEWNFPCEIMKGCTYVMLLELEAAPVPPTLEPRELYLAFQISPANATLEVDGETWPIEKDGTSRKRVEAGTYTYFVKAPNYESEKREIVVEETSVVVRVSLKPVLAEKKKTERRGIFVTLDGAYAPFSVGFSVGMVKRYGWFVSAMTNGSFAGMGNLTQVDAQGFLEDGHLPMYNGTKATDRLSVIAGGMMRVVQPLYVRVGVGYGVRNLSWQDKEQQWYKIKEYSFQGVDVSAGVQAHWGGFVVSLDAVTTNFQTLEGKLGLGYVF